MINIKINDQTIVVDQGTTIIQATDLLKTYVPRLCYHKKLSVAGNCRMCLVEVMVPSKTIPQGSQIATNVVGKLLPACSTIVTEGMQIFTNSDQTCAARKAVLEILLANHPLDCPVCVQAGECELQDLSIQYGKDTSRYQEPKRIVIDQNLGPLIDTNMTRCIHCTRCVRFGEEIAGKQELGVMYRGEKTQIGTVIEPSITSEVSGNIIDLCPVGALYSKPFKFNARPWELQQKFSISWHDCLGSNIYYHINSGQIKRAVPCDNSAINSIWLSDRDRFGFIGVNHHERLKHPLLKKDGKWHIVSWQEAMTVIYKQLMVIIDTYGAQEIGGIISPSASLEACFIFQKLIRGLGSNNIDHRLQQIDFRAQDMAPLYPNLGLSTVEDLQQQKVILLIGSELHKEQPIAGIHVRKAVLTGCAVIVVNSIDFDFNFNIEHKYLTPYANLVMPLLKLAKALTTVTTKPLPIGAEQLLNNIEYSNTDLTIAKKILAEEQTLILLGQLANNHPEYSRIVAVSNLICLLTNAKFGCFSEGSNSAGAWLAGCIPHRGSIEQINDNQQLNKELYNGKNTWEMLQQPLKAYILLGIEPELDCAAGINATKVLEQSELVVAISLFDSSLLQQYANVILPMASPAESTGSYINITGTWQHVEQIIKPLAECKSTDQILLELSNLLLPNELSTLDVNMISPMLQLAAFKARLNTNWQWWCPLEPVTTLVSLHPYINKNFFVGVKQLTLYAVDAIVRRAGCLQATKDAQPEIAINEKAAKQLKINNGEIVRVMLASNLNNIIKLAITINNKIADGCMLIKQSDLHTTILLPYENFVLEKIDA